MGEKNEYRLASNSRLYENYDRSITKRLEDHLRSLQVLPQQEFNNNAISVLKKRYLAKDEDGTPLEDPRGLMIRVAANIAYPDFHYTGDEKTTIKTAEKFYNMMMDKEFMPNSPTLMNAGRKMQQLSACFVLPIADKMKVSPKDPPSERYKGAILDALKDTGDVHQTGGGTGFSFGNLRRKNDFVSTTYGKASGPVSFISAFDAMTHSVNQGGFRRGANMGMLPITHPDILQFIHAKENESSGKYTNFNFSIAVTEDFMRAVDKDEYYILKNPRKGKLYDLTTKDLERDSKSVKEGLIKEIERVLVADEQGNIIYQNPTEFDEKGEIKNVAKTIVGKVDEQGRVTLHARGVFNELVRLAHNNGEPGVVFIDRLNEGNPTHPRYYKGGLEDIPLGVGIIEATNPCGEQPLLGYEACNLGSINLGVMVKDGKIDYTRLGKTVDTATQFLDNVIDMGDFPLEQISETVHRNRKIGLGVMGWADALVKLGIPYSSDSGVALAEEVMKFIRERGIKKSEELAVQRGVFPNFEHSMYANDRPRRNATITTIAPTGTISIIAGASGAIEPFFDVMFYHTDADGHSRKFLNKELMTMLKNRSIDADSVEKDLLSGKKLKDLEAIPEDIKKIFLTANDIPVEYHVKMQSAFQKYTDNAVSKTINLPRDSTIKEVENAFRMTYELGCKGVTVYVDESRKKQVLNRAKGKQDLETLAVSESSTIARGEMKSLPDHLPAVYIKQQTPWGHLHLNISLDPTQNYKEVQVFAQLGKSGDVVNADLEAMSRLASTTLRLGGDIKKHVVDQMEGIGSHKMIPTIDGPVVSLPDAVAKALLKYSELREKVGPEKLLLGQYNLDEIKKEKIEKKLNSKAKNSQEPQEDWGFKCPDCGENILREAGCLRCPDPNCGWSKC